jgi:hypothetical protein
MDKIISVLGLLVQVFSDVIPGDLTEDGEREEWLNFYVVIEDKSGRRWASTRSFIKKVRWDNQPEADADSYRVLVAQYLAKGHHPARSDKWVSIAACYGSAAYSDAEAVAWEKGIEEQEQNARYDRIALYGTAR